MILMKKLSLLLSVFIPLLSCAENLKPFFKFDIISRQVDSSLVIYAKYPTGKLLVLDEVEVPNDIPVLNFSIKKIINGKHYIILSISYNEDYRDSENRVNYVGEYNIINVYECQEKCKINLKLSNFFGNGGDVEGMGAREIIYKFPYHTINDINKELDSSFFNRWINGKITSGYVTHKTFIYDVNNNVIPKNKYLIQDDQFKMKDVSSRWLNISYTNKKGKVTTGWISCNDTNICN